MKSVSTFRCLFVFCIPVLGWSQHVVPAAKSNALPDYLQQELALTETARGAAANDDDVSFVTLLNRAPDPQLNIPISVARMRRAAIICGVLSNNGAGAAAKHVAQIAISQNAHDHEQQTADHVERLYWEAVLQCEYLRSPINALPLLKEAEGLAPTDQRLLDLEARATALSRHN